MSDDDLDYLRKILSNMDGNEEIKVGLFIFTASEFVEVVDDARSHRKLNEIHNS